MRLTSPSSVAEKKSVWRSWRTRLTMRSTAGRKPRSSMRSASSSTSIETESRRRRRRCDQILEAAGRGHQDVRAGGLLGLAVDADAAEGGGDAQTAGARERRRLVCDLHRELAGGHQHEAGGNLGVTRDALDHGDREGDRLAAARGRLGEDVASGERVAAGRAPGWGRVPRCRAARAQRRRARTRPGRGRTSYSSVQLLAVDAARSGAEEPTRAPN